MLLRQRRWSTVQVARAINRSQPYVSKRLRAFEGPVLAQFARQHAQGVAGGRASQYERGPALRADERCRPRAEFSTSQAQYDTESRILRAVDLREGSVLQQVGIAEAKARGRNQVTTRHRAVIQHGWHRRPALYARPTCHSRRSDGHVEEHRSRNTPHGDVRGRAARRPVWGIRAERERVSGHATNSSASDSVNSGFIGNMGPTFGSTFQVTFKTPGIYPYICALHDDQGMVGTTTVLS